jgi:hypothetical protein
MDSEPEPAPGTTLKAELNWWFQVLIQDWGRCLELWGAGFPDNRCKKPGWIRAKEAGLLLDKYANWQIDLQKPGFG